MFYHVRITQKSNNAFDEVKLDLSKERLFSQFIELYDKGNPIIINGKTILPQDIERITITETDKNSSQIFPEVRFEREQSNVISFISDEWHVADKGKDITDELIKGAPGYKKTEKESKSKKIDKSNKIFIVHGHDQALKNDLEIFLKNIGLRPIVLHRQSDKGLTIIEKLEENTNVGYAFVLITPDDIGYPVEQFQKSEKEKNIEYRARQNVIFEFGYLVGKLGRSKVCCLYKQKTTIPTDLSGFIYKKVATSIEGIGYDLIKELKTAGYKIKI